MQIVDPHVHFWNPTTHHYPWLAQPQASFVGDITPLCRPYEVQDLLAESGQIEVLKVVHIEANHDPAQPVAETRWLQAMADRPAEGAMPNAIVAAADFSAADAPAVLAAHAAYPNVRGIRHILNVHHNPRYDYAGRHYLQEALWQSHFALLAQNGWSFDLQIYPSQMPQAAALARQHPDIPLILNHAGMFVDRDSLSGWQAWCDGLRALAACDNVAVKLSGFAMFDHQWTVESIRPYVLTTLDIFGVERCMFASNFPVDGLHADYAQLWTAYAATVAGASVSEQAALFCHNAERYYRI